MDPWHIGPRLRYWRKRRGLTIAALADLVGRSSSWVQMAETGHRAPYNILDLVNLAVMLRVDLGAFLCDPVPGIPDGDQQQLLVKLRDAFEQDDPRTGLTRLAHRLNEADAETDLMLAVLPGGQWKVVSRRSALKLGAVLGVSLISPALNPDQASELVTALESHEVSRAGVDALRAIVAAYRRLDDEIGSTTLRPLVEHNLRIVKGLRPRSDAIGLGLGSVAAELDQLAGWLSFDMGDYDRATSRYRSALKAANAVNDQAVAAHVFQGISRMETSRHNGRAAIQAADFGLARAAQTPSRKLRSSVAMMKARAHAEAGEPDATRAAIELAERELRAAKPEDDPPFIYYFDQTGIDGHAAAAHMTLRQAAPAMDTAHRAAEGVDRRYVRDRAHYLIYWASSLALAEEIPECCRVALTAADLLEQASSTRTVRLLRELHAVQLRPYWAIPEVRELGDRLYAL